MASASKTPIKVFFNEEIKKKYDEIFASRPFIFNKSFDVKEESHLETLVCNLMLSSLVKMMSMEALQVL
ncbi:hypothetical protein V6N11_037756 [Hibiscus sabdariffa]|uniref:Uncharacterized protein n=2 Tax=Hibiscus sabdariffa TaxID=183260 RepID=A0ABR2AQA8_9ROSI